MATINQYAFTRQVVIDIDISIYMTFKTS